MILKAQTSGPQECVVISLILDKVELRTVELRSLTTPWEWPMKVVQVDTHRAKTLPDQPI